MDIAPPRTQEPPRRPPVLVNLNAINTEAETSTGFNSAAPYQKRLKITSLSSNIFSDEYIILEPEISQMEQRVPKTTPSRVGSTPRGSPYEPPSVSATPNPDDFKIDVAKVRDERPNAAGKKGSVDSSYNVVELKNYLSEINRYRRERGLPRLVANDRKGYVDAIREFFGAEPDVGGIGRKAKAKAKAEPKGIAKPSSSGPGLKPTSIQVTTTSPRGPVTLKSKKPAAPISSKSVAPPKEESDEESESESIEPIERSEDGGSDEEGSDIDELTTRMKGAAISKKPAAPIRRSELSKESLNLRNSESESESEEEERPQKKPVGLARSKIAARK